MNVNYQNFKDTTIIPNKIQQQPRRLTDTIQYFYDTAKVFCWYVNDLQFGTAITSYCFRVTKSKMDFAQPTPEELKNDSFIVKKQKISIGSIYFIPRIITDSSIKKGQKSKQKLVYVQIPQDLILNDWNKNFDYLLPKEEKKKTK